MSVKYKMRSAIRALEPVSALTGQSETVLWRAVKLVNMCLFEEEVQPDHGIFAGVLIITMSLLLFHQMGK